MSVMKIYYIITIYCIHTSGISNRAARHHSESSECQHHQSQPRLPSRIHPTAFGPIPNRLPITTPNHTSAHNHSQPRSPTSIMKIHNVSHRPRIVEILQ